MGANAQTTVPTFTTGQVLTADQQNQSARTGVPVFASTVTRDAGFGGTGEKTLAEGQLCYVEGTGLQSYNGTSWVTWGAAPSAGLTFISSTTIGTTVSSVTVSNAFSSTYDNYRIIVSGGVASTNNFLTLTLGSTNTGYYRWVVYGNYNANTPSGGSQTNGTSWESSVYGTTANLHGVMDLFGPNLAKTTQYVSAVVETRTTGLVGFQGGYLNDTTAYTAFTLTTNTGTITGGNIRVYGYQNS